MKDTDDMNFQNDFEMYENTLSAIGTFKGAARSGDGAHVLDYVDLADKVEEGIEDLLAPANSTASDKRITTPDEQPTYRLERR